MRILKAMHQLDFSQPTAKLDQIKRKYEKTFQKSASQIVLLGTHVLYRKLKNEKEFAKLAPINIGEFKNIYYLNILLI